VIRDFYLKISRHSHLSNMVDTDSHDPNIPCASLLRCLKPKGVNLSWVCCDDCSLWFHVACVNWPAGSANPNVDFHCGCTNNPALIGKCRGACSVCHQLFTVTGSGDASKVSRHGRRNSPCSGSGQPPDFKVPLTGPKLGKPVPIANAPLVDTDITAQDVLWPCQTIRCLPSALIRLAADSLAKALQSVCDSPIT